MKLLIPVALVGLFTIQCTKNYTDYSCINKKIGRIKSQRKWNPPAQVNEYIYKGKHVFLFSADCCDQFSELFDENCNRICAPYGGISGQGDGTCTDFQSTAQFVKLVWKDDR